MTAPASDLAYLPLHAAADLLGSRRLSPVELLDTVLSRTNALEPALNVYITPMFDQARAAAQRAEQEIVDGQYRGPLHGIPIALKDNFWTRGVRTTAGSRLLADFIPDEDAAVVSRLESAGAVITGKCAMHELATGGTTTNLIYGATHNPWDLERIPGGSSGGSAAAVAAGLAYAALGTDTAGSVRQPAAHCGVVGLKPTYGRVSTFGVVPLAWSLDHVGPLARTARDTALVLGAVAGVDVHDPNSAAIEVPSFESGLDAGLSGVRIGLPRRYFFDQLDPQVERVIEEALGVLLDLEAIIQDVEFPSAFMTPTLYPLIARPEGAAYQREFLRDRSDQYGDPLVRRSSQLGALVLAQDYVQAQRLRMVMSQSLNQLFEDVDLLLTPVTPTPAFPIGKPPAEVDGRPIEPFELVVGLTAPFDLTGTPAVSVLCGFTPDGLPVGMQIAGPRWDEAGILAAAAAYEAATPWHERHPTL